MKKILMVLLCLTFIAHWKDFYGHKRQRKFETYEAADEFLTKDCNGCTEMVLEKVYE